ncbi:hypothetical protein [Methylobacter sp.]|uniref:hypothetical protein n=1 Tax=Methylobacter sp. TaxID=2051955 RepID=UPI001218E86F|nr:hypothetical protein [Methylobacter sp.]TAK63180.1 MAG: hypothetical protein EPO18_07660 [Methylobacter sp.]
MAFGSELPALELFIDKTSKLENSGFVNKIRQEFTLDINIDLSRTDVLEVRSIRPNQENIDAFILTFRFFIQDNEAISIRKLQKFFDSNFVTNEEKTKFNAIRKSLNDFLSENSNLIFKEENISNSLLMDTFIYGGLSHATKGKKEKFDLWMSRDDAQEFFWHKFSIIIFTVLQAIQSIRDMLLIVIERNKNA